MTDTNQHSTLLDEAREEAKALRMVSFHGTPSGHWFADLDGTDLDGIALLLERLIEQLETAKQQLMPPGIYAEKLRTLEEQFDALREAVLESDQADLIFARVRPPHVLSRDIEQGG